MALIKPRMQRTLKLPALREITGLIITVVVSRASILGMYPFGAAYFAARFGKGLSYGAIAAVFIGLASAGTGISLMKYMIAVLIYALYSKLRPKSGYIINASVCGGSVLIGGLIFALYSYAGAYDLILAAAEGIISAIMYIIFTKSEDFIQSANTRTSPGRDTLMSAAVFAGVLITGVSDIRLPIGIGLSGIAAAYAVLCMADACSIGAAGGGGLCMGFMCAMSDTSAVISAGFYGICAVFANLLRSFGRIGTAVGFWGGAAACMIYMQYAGGADISIWNIAIATALFMLSPKKIRKGIEEFFSGTRRTDAAAAQDRVRFYIGSRLEGAAKGFKELEESFVKASEQRLNRCHEDAVDIFDDTASRVCRGCPMSVKCYEKDFTGTYSRMLELLKLAESGELDDRNIPEKFMRRCVKAADFSRTMKHVYELYRMRELFKGEAVKSRDIAAMQYKDISRLLDSMAQSAQGGVRFCPEYEDSLIEELDKNGIALSEISVIERESGAIEVHLGLKNHAGAEKIENIIYSVTGVKTELSGETLGTAVFVSKPVIDIETGACAVPIQISSESGDVIEFFEADGYMSYVILCDGMGTGKEAMLQSRELVRLLRSFLESGFDAETALRTVNSALCLRLDRESTAAVDLLCIDRLKSTAKLYKTGSAQSLILHNGESETVFPASVPAGMLPEINTVPRSFRLSSGDVIALASDGVTQAGGRVYREWALKAIEEGSASECARKIIDKALSLCGGTAYDDMSAAVIKII